MNPNEQPPPHLRPDVMQKLRDKAEQIKKNLTPEGSAILESAIEQFGRGAMSVSQLTNLHTTIKQRYSLPPSAQPAMPPQQQPIQQQVVPQQQPIQQVPRNAMAPAITVDLTAEEKQILNMLKNMPTEERKNYAKTNVQIRNVLQKVQRMKTGGGPVKQEVSEPYGSAEPPKISFLQQLGSMGQMSSIPNTGSMLGMLGNIPTQPVVAMTPSSMEASSTMQPPTKKQKRSKVEEEEEEKPQYSFVSDEEVHSSYISKYQPEPSFLSSLHLKNKINRIVKNQGLKQNVGDALCDFISLAVQDRMRTILEELIVNSKLRVDTPISAEKNAAFIEVTSDANYTLHKHEAKISERVFQEDKLRREEEERKRKQAGDNKRKRTQSSKDEEEQRVSEMNETIGALLGPKKSSSSNLTSTSTPSKSTSSSLKKVQSSGSISDTKNTAQSTTSSTEEEQQTVIPITAQDVILFLEQEPQLRKSKLLYHLYLDTKDSKK